MQEHKLCLVCNRRYSYERFDSEYFGLCIVCKSQKRHFEIVANIVLRSRSLNERIFSNISEYQIENNVRFSDKEIKLLCKTRIVETSEHLRECDQLFLQLHHNNEMVI